MGLYKHQEELVNKQDLPDKFLLAWDTGTGKTFTSIAIADKRGQDTLVICPKSLAENWEEEIKKFSKHPERYVVITKETFRKYWDKVAHCNNIIIDEAHYFFGDKSTMRKNLIKYLTKHNPFYVTCLTATPYMSTPWNIYWCAKILGFYPNYLKFKNTFFYPMKLGRNTFFKPKKNIQKQIGDVVKQLGFTKKIEECVDIPEKIFQVEYFELTTDQKRAIKEIDDFLPIVRFTKIHQICGGTLKGDKDFDIPDKIVDCNKRNRVIELIKEHKKIILSCRYNLEIAALKELIPEAYVIDGRTHNVQELVDEINNTTTSVVLVNAKKSEGYNLPDIPIMVFYDYDFSYKDFYQMCGRIRRVTHPEPRVYLSLVVKDTIDEHVYKCIHEDKNDFQVEIYAKNRS